MAERKKIRLPLQEVQPGMAVAEPICLEGEKKRFFGRRSLADGADFRAIALARARGGSGICSSRE